MIYSSVVRNAMARSASRRRVAYKKRIQNRFSMFLVTLVMVMLLVVVGVRTVTLTRERDALQAQVDQQERDIAAERLRSEEIEEYGRYTQTKAYYEQVAKEKLGLVYPDEILFKEVD